MDSETSHLSTIQDFQSILKTIHSSSSSLTGSATTAVATTLSILYPNISTNNTNRPFLDTQHITLVASSAPSHSSPTLSYLGNLTGSANLAANSLTCGSFLLGHTSESDGFGDVAFCLGSGDFSAGNELRVIQALGLDAGNKPEIHNVKLSPSTKLSDPLPSMTPEVISLIELLSKLQEVHSFRTSITRRVGDLVLFFLLGRLKADWVGLLGVGVWSDI